MKSRTRARGVALQALYEIDVSDHPPGDVWQQRVSDEELENKLADFAREIIFGVYPIRTILDELIAQHAPEWPLDQVAVIDRNILRIAIWEIAIYQKTPTKVAINEAVELSKVYGSDSTPRFVNGVLGSIVEHYNELLQAFRKYSQDDAITEGSPPEV